MTPANNMNTVGSVWDKLFMVLCFAIVAVASYAALTNPYLWFDEAGQFWISLGLNHFSEPFAAHGTISDVIEGNRYYNMDPGGFSVLLHLWLQVSTNTVFVRLLPWLFFVVACTLMYKTCKYETDDRLFAVFMFTLPFLMIYVANKSAELRAYSMEMMGIMASVYMLTRVKNHLTVGNLLALSAILAFTCTSRYASVIAAFALSIRVVYLLYKQDDFKGFLAKVAVYAAPLLLAVGVIYIGMMSIQNANAEKMPYSEYIFSSPSLLVKPMSLLFYAFLAVCWYVSRKEGELSEISKCALIVAVVFFLFSAVDKFPWNMIRTMPTTILLLNGLLTELMKMAGSRKRAVYFFMAGLLTVMSVFWVVMFGRLHRGDRIDPQMQEWQTLMASEKPEKIFVSSGLNPCLRHYYEHGAGKAMQQQEGYPERLFLQKGGRHAFSSADKKNYRPVQPYEVEADYYFMNREDLMKPGVKERFVPYKTFKYISIKQ